MEKQPIGLEYISNTDHIIEICANTIRLYDSRIIDYGERVAYIASRIYERLEQKQMDITILLMLCIFHDIGAYKTEEVDQMNEYETSKVLEHSSYGYLFIKYFSPWPEYGEAILHHHTSYERLKKMQLECRDYASLLHLADRIDLAVLNGRSKEEIIREAESARFHPKHAAVLKRLLGTTDFYEILKSQEMAPIYERLKQMHDLTFEQALKMLQMLIFSIDFKSEVTVAHSIATAKIATFLARYLKLPEETVKKIYVGSLLHDIGKITTPEDILEKKGKLSLEEMDVMRKHVEMSEKILKDVLSPEVVAIAVRHHEKLDGSGYPYGLKAEQLTIEERIVAAADITSAFLSKRSYKQEFGIQQTMELLQDMADRRQIDSSLVKIICENIEEIREGIQEENEIVNKLYQNMREEYAELRSGKKTFI